MEKTELSEVVETKETRIDPPVGSYAYTARFLAESGLMTGEEADDWKDRMKEMDENFDPFDRD